MKIAVICALEEEISLLRNHMGNISSADCAGIKITLGTLFPHEIILCVGGVGKANAAAATQFIISTYQPNGIINIGLAGNCCALPLGGIVIANRLLYHDFEMKFAAESSPWLMEYTPDTSFMNIAHKVCHELGLESVVGTVATGDQFIESNDRRAAIIAKTSCSCVEMEGASIAHIAHKNGVPYTVVKVLSDNADESAHDDFNASLPLGAYCKTSTAIVRGILSSLLG